MDDNDDANTCLLMFIECLLYVSHCNQCMVTLKIIVDYVRVLKGMFLVTKLHLHGLKRARLSCP